MALTAAMLLQYFQATAEFFYIDELNLPPSHYALAIGIFAIWSAINDPLAGYFMDRTRTRWGRRFPWIIASIIPLCVSYYLIWAPPSSFQSTNNRLLVWLIIVLLIFDLSYTFVVLGWASLFPELYTTIEERSNVLGIRQVFAFLAFIVALVIAPSIVEDENIPSYKTFGLVIVSIALVNMILSLPGIRVHKHQIEEVSDESFRVNLRIIKQNKSFRIYLFLNLIVFFAYGQFLSMIPFYRKVVLGQDAIFQRNFFLLGALFTPFAIVFWVSLSKIKDPTYIFKVGSLCAIAALPFLWIVTDPIYAAIFLGIAGFGLGGLLFIVDLLLADVIDQDYLSSGLRREGVFFGFNGFFIRFAILIQSLALWFVTKFIGFDPSANDIDTGTITSIKLQLTFFPLISLIIAVLLVHYKYDLKGDLLLAQREEIAAPGSIRTYESKGLN